MFGFENLRISKNYLITFITEFIILISGILIYKIAAHNLGTIGFSEYSLSRRTISFIQPLLLLGIGVGLSRYIAFNNEKLKNNTDTYFISGIIILFTTGLLFIFIINFFSSTFSYLFFGDNKYHSLIFPISIMLFGLINHSACYSYFRGKLDLVTANILQFINIGLIPIIIIYRGTNLIHILLITGILWNVVSLIFLIIALKKIIIKREHIYGCGKELLYYGIQRIPGDILISGFLSIPAFFISHENGIITGGYVAFGMTMLNMTGAFFAPISLVLLPEASKLITNKNYKELKVKTNNTIKWTLILTIFGLLISEILLNQIINIYLGKSFHGAVTIVRIILLASIGYTIYISLRSILDAFYVKAMNTKNILISFALMVILTFLFTHFTNNYYNLLWIFVLSMLLLGSLTLFETIKIFNKVHD